MEKEYSKSQLLRLHNELYDILSKIIEICDKHNIHYFAIGGTVIGAMYDNAILPWDDDIDIGMTRENYNKFLKIAPNELGDMFFLSETETDPRTPFFYAKVKKNDTFFIEEKYQHIDMHQGIFVDVFPFDNVPNNQSLRKLQFKAVNFIKTCFMGKEVWMWNRFKKCDISKPLDRSFVSTFLCWCVVSLFPKKTINNIMKLFMTFYNRKETSHVGLVVTTVDYFKRESVNSLQRLPFGPLYIMAATNLEEYLKYNSLHRFTEEELINHKSHQPLFLKFSK